MRVIDVISWFSCSETLIYIIKFQFQPNLRWSNFWLYYCEIQTSNGFSALVFWDMKILKPVLCLFMNLEAMLEPAESSEKVTKIQPPYYPSDWSVSNSRSGVPSVAKKAGSKAHPHCWWQWTHLRLLFWPCDEALRFDADWKWRPNFFLLKTKVNE